MARCNVTYAQALEYVACNDNPGETGLSDIESAVSTDLLAYIYGKSARTVAREILRMRLDGDPETAGQEIDE
jgi:hypothetical protein